jgi:SAM-dependent methyltransferase
MSHPEVTSFTEIAEFYDDLMKPVPYRMWSSYYLLLLSMQGQKPKSVLDACCGTGTLTHMLTHEGLEVEGFDLSEPMIRQARLKAERRKMPLRFEVANACTVENGSSTSACATGAPAAHCAVNTATGSREPAGRVKRRNARSRCGVPQRPAAPGRKLPRAPTRGLTFEE